MPDCPPSETEQLKAEIVLMKPVVEAATRWAEANANSFDLDTVLNALSNLSAKVREFETLQALRELGEQ